MQKVKFNHFRDVQLHQLESKFIKRNPNNIRGSFWFKVIYLKQSEVINEFDSFK